ncbi:MAG: SDR family oxidoreductase [Longimicrobiales bacterium]|nr:SDR family oxidoreductase [Longimicrobiales bacterium]
MHQRTVGQVDPQEPAPGPFPGGGRVLVTGATGYIGGRLVPRLLREGYRVRCLVRAAAKVRGRPWGGDPGLEVVQGDAGDPGALDRALEGQDAAFYLIHSMVAAGGAYADRDRVLAERFAGAARRQRVGRIVYLGGLGETGPGLSEHLASRREVEAALASTGVPVTVLRAAMIIGSGSASFEILRYLVERLPVMITPRWVQTECQPIAVRDVLRYLVATLRTPGTVGRTLDVGGPEVLTYAEVMRTMAEARGLRPRVILPVPVLTPRLSSLWIQLVTPLSARIARPLAEGLRNRVVCGDDEAVRLMPGPRLTVREAIDAALGTMARHEVETAWSDAGVVPGDPDWAGGTTFVDRRVTGVRASPEAAFRAVCRVGGGHGYYAADVLWRIRGAMDRLVGGPGLRRGRRDPDRLAVGDALDFWRVRELVPGRVLRLRAEMKLPGEAELAFQVHPPSDGSPLTTVEQIARFKPRGLLGLLYWGAVLPLHGVVFRGMLRGIRGAAEAPLRATPGSTMGGAGGSGD